MKQRVGFAVVAVCFSMTFNSCAPDSESTGSLSHVGVVACSDQVFWATITEAGRPSSPDVVRVRVREWLKPNTGPEEMTLTLGDTGSINEREPFLVAMSSAKSNGEPSTFFGEDAKLVASAAGTREPCPSNY